MFGRSFHTAVNDAADSVAGAFHYSLMSVCVQSQVGELSKFDAREGGFYSQETLGEDQSTEERGNPKHEKPHQRIFTLACLFRMRSMEYRV